MPRCATKRPAGVVRSSGSIAGELPVADAGHGVVAPRQAQQRGGRPADPSAGIEDEDPGLDLVDDHERHTPVVAGIDDPVRDMANVARGRLAPENGAFDAAEGGLQGRAGRGAGRLRWCALEGGRNGNGRGRHAIRPGRKPGKQEQAQQDDPRAALPHCHIDIPTA